MNGEVVSVRPFYRIVFKPLLLLVGVVGTASISCFLISCFLSTRFGLRGSAGQGQEAHVAYSSATTVPHQASLEGVVLLEPFRESALIEQAPTPSFAAPESESEEPPELGFDERMSLKYAGFTRGQLLDARLALRETLNALTKDYYEAEFEAGRFEFHVLEPNEKGWRSIPNVPGELSSLRYKPGGEARIVRLPREGFEEAYALSDETLWILNRESELERPTRTVKR